MSASPSSQAKPSVSVFIDPLSRHLEGDRLFDSRNSRHGGDSILEPYAYARRRLGELGIPVHTGDLLESGAVAPAEVNVYVTMGIRSRYRRLARRSDVILSAFFVPECPVAEPTLYRDLDDASDAFRRMYSFSTDEALRPFLRRPVHFLPFRFPQAFDRVHEEVWLQRDRGFLSIINANKSPRIQVGELYTERLRAVEYFSRWDEVDLYGIGWDGPPFRIGTTRLPGGLRRLGYKMETSWRRVVADRDPLRVAARKAWRGAVVSKAQTLGRYTFAICFENMILDGWVTEKIFDCLQAGTIPVYLGAPDIEQWVDPACFIDMRRFSDYDELRSYLHGLGPRELDAYREAGREYFRSDLFRPFAKHAFVEIFERILAEDAAVAV